MSATNNLTLLQFNVNSFAKIDRNNPVVIVFPDGFNMCLLEGNQAVGKTSTLEAIKAVMGLALADNAVNKTDNDMNALLEFKKNGILYRVKLTKSRFEVLQLVDEKWATLKSPKTMLSELIGPVGLDPMFLKGYDNKKQIEWLRSYYRLTPEQVDLEKQIDENIAKTYQSRRDTNRDLKRIEQELNQNPYYTSRHDWKAKLDQFKWVDINASLMEAQDKMRMYSNSEQAVIQWTERIPVVEEEVMQIQDDIEELQKKLAEAIAKKENKVNELNTLHKRIQEGQKYLDDHKEDKTAFEEISKQQQEQEEMNRHANAFNEMVKLDEQSQHLHAEFIRLQNRLDEYRKAKRKFIEAITPEVEGLEIYVADEENPKEGIFYFGKQIVELSESELWGLYAQLLEKLKVRIILIENLSSLGSGAVELFNKFIESGGYIMASQMNRKQDSLKITFTNQIAE